MVFWPLTRMLLALSSMMQAMLRSLMLLKRSRNAALAPTLIEGEKSRKTSSARVQTNAPSNQNCATSPQPKHYSLVVLVCSGWHSDGAFFT